MKKQIEYLTDAELESITGEIVKKELIPAPHDLQVRILEALELEIKALEEQRTRDKILEYKRYRFRVMTTVAAAVLVVFLLPKFETLLQQEKELIKPLTKQEYTIQNRYETKDDALKDIGILENILGGVNIFADNNKYNLFRK